MSHLGIPRKHGLFLAPEGYGHHPLRGIWQGMIRRCHDPGARNFGYYGARGIVVCERWRGVSGLPNFIADMGARPSAAHSLDRIDPDGPYAPDNCRWSTQGEQQRNRRPRGRSGVLGVYQVDDTRWRAFAWVDGRKRHLGYFPSRDEAIAAQHQASGLTT